MRDFKELLYESVLFSFGKILAKYNAFAQKTIIKDAGGEILNYLKENGFGFKEDGNLSDLDKVIKMFVENGFVDELKVEEVEKGSKYYWKGLYGNAAYKKLQELTENPFISCPLNASMYYIADKHNKELALYSKKFDLETGITMSQEGIIDKQLGDKLGFDPLTLESVQLYDRAEREVQKVKDKLLQAAKLSIVGEYTATIIHDIRDPLNVLSGFLDVLKEELASEKPDYNLLKQLEKSASMGIERLFALIGRMGRFVRQKTDFKAGVSLKDVVNNSITFTSKKINKNKIEVKNTLTDDLPGVYGDEVSLEQVFTNIISNACDAFEGREDRKITISGTYTDSEVSVQVEDNGCGIDLEDQTEVFEAFFTTKAKGEGTGLGLSSSKLIMDNHRGRIDLFSVVGTGTKFTVILKRNPPA